MNQVTTATAQARKTLSAYWVSAVAATAGLLFGFDIAVINGAIVLMRSQFQLTEFQTEIAASSLLFGCVVGASIAGWVSDRFGRRKTLIYAALLFAISAVGAALPRDLVEFIAARFIGGVAVGAASLLAPLYIAEVSPPHIRGRLVSLNQMAIVTGILLAYFVNWMLSFGGESNWRWMFAVAALPSLGFFIALFFVPESPRWLAAKGLRESALDVLTRLNGSDVARAEIVQIETAIASESGTLAELFRPVYRKPLAIALSLAILQQITGINTVLFYGSVIVKEQIGNHSDSAAIGVNVVIGVINFIATVVALWVIDRLGRRPLLLISSGVMAVCLAALGAAFLIQPPPATLILAIMALCVAAFAIGLGPGVWVVISEIFPSTIRGRAMSIATIGLWSACIALTMTFLSLVSAISITGAFWLYGGMCVVTFLLVLLATPETKGRTLEEIEAMWRSRRI